MFEKFSYSRKTTPFNNKTKTNEDKEGTSRERRVKKGRTLNLEEVVVAVTETPVGSPAGDSNNDDCDSTDDEDLLKPALRTDSEDNNEEKGLINTHTDSMASSSKRRPSKKVQKKYKGSIHNGNFVKSDDDIVRNSPRKLLVRLEDIFPNEKEEIKRRAVELSSNLEDAVDTVLALKASEENNDNNNDNLIIKKDKKTKTRRKRVLSFSDSDSDVCQTPKKQKYLSVGKCPNMANNIAQKKEFKNKNIKDNQEVIEISDNEDESRDIEIDEEEEEEEDESDDDDYGDVTKATILSFLNDSSKEEINSIPGFSSSKSEKLIRLRPFGSWKDLNSKLQAAKGLTVQIIWDCNLLLEKRVHVMKLMKKCEKIARNIQKMLSDQSNGFENSNISQPEIINKSCKLKPYQLTGLSWLTLMHKQDMNGILADEMGLGKTIQALSFIAHLIENGDNGPYLIVAPASTIDNWVNELERWCPTVEYIKYYGSAEERCHLRQEILSSNLEYQVIITTYQMVVSNPQDRSLFRKLDTHYVVFDEGHMLKNMKSQRYQRLINLRARRRLLLTGTPLQNNLLELMSLLSFVMPHMFDKSSEGLKLLFSDKRTEESSVTYEKEILEQAKRIMKPFVLRRLKTDVLRQLPQKHEEVIMCDLTEQQRLLYEKVFLECCQSYKQSESDTLSQNLMYKNLMMPLRMTSNHPVLLRNHFTDEKLLEMATQYCRDLAHRDCNPDLVYEDMTVMSDFEINRLCMQEYKLSPYILDQEILWDSGKFNTFDSILPTMKKQGDRVLLFSQFTLVMDVIEVYLRHNNYRFLRLDGSTKVGERQNLIDKFNNEPDIFIFLLSTRAGGLGINLTSANVVILNDIDFNPYNDKQAEDRCHRVGQTRDVRVYKLISKNTIEEAILKCANSKLKLEKDVVSADDDEEDIAFILGQTFKNGGSS